MPHVVFAFFDSPSSQPGGMEQVGMKRGREVDFIEPGKPSDTFDPHNLVRTRRALEMTQPPKSSHRVV